MTLVIKSLDLFELICDYPYITKYNTHIQRHNHYKKYWETQDYCSTKYLTSIFSEKETGAGMVLPIKLSK